jgi:rhamnosyltransferase subunit B
MARLLVTCAGSMGDLLPYASLGQRLRERGHSVTFAVEQRFAEWLNKEGFVTHVLDGDIIATFLAILPQYRMTTDSVRTIKLLLDAYLLPTLPKRVEELCALCQDTDLLISSTVQIASSITADLTGIPWVSIALTPATIPDPAFAPFPYVWPHSPRTRSFLNSVAWSLGRRTFRALADKPINRTRAQIGLPHRHDILFDGGISPMLTTVTVSPALLPPCPTWPPQVVATGFCFWDADTWEEPSDLTTFLAGEHPVIAISLGSVSPKTGMLLAPLYQVSIAAIHAVGARALVFGAPPEALPALTKQDYALAYAPHSRIFPRCKAVIHHGGIGTAAQAWRAGIPALVVPGGVDQYLTASLVIERGVGQWLRRERFTLTNVAKHLQVLLDDAGILRRARHLGQHIQGEDGASRLADAIERHLHLNSEHTAKELV